MTHVMNGLLVPNAQGAKRYRRWYRRPLPVAGDLFFGGLGLMVPAALLDVVAWTHHWLFPGILILIWSAGRQAVRAWRPSWVLRLALFFLLTLLAAKAPAWPGGETVVLRLIGFGMGVAASVAWRGLARVAQGPMVDGAELARVFVLLLCVVATWYVYLTPRIVGTVDERWYGDLMADNLAQVRAGVFPVLVGQGAYAWNGNVHPFRSAPWHHVCGALVDKLTIGQFSPLAVQHVVVFGHELLAVLLLYAGLRRLRPNQPWLVLLIAILFGCCPAVTMAQVAHDMYMTSMAVPVVVGMALALVAALERESWRAWAWLGAGLGFVWFCHPPMALISSALVAATILAYMIAEPTAIRRPARMVAMLVAMIAVSVGYFVSMREITPLRSSANSMVRDVLLPTAAWLGVIVGSIGLRGTRRLPLTAVFGGAIAVGLIWLFLIQPVLVWLATALLAAVFIGERWRRQRWMPGIDILFAGTLLVWAAIFGPGQPGDGTVDQHLAASREGYGALWTPLHFGGFDQLGYAVGLGLVLVVVSQAFRRHAIVRALAFSVGAAMVLLAPIPGVARYFWQNQPKEILDVISVAYALRFLPATAPFAAVLIGVGMASAEPRFRRFGAVCLLVLLPWSLWEHSNVVHRAWDYRHSAALTQNHLRPENRALSRFHYDLEPIPPYLDNGVADYRLETRIWRPGGGSEPVGPDQLASAMATTADSSWVNLKVRQDPTYPAWLYLEPKILLQPGERRVLSFAWDRAISDGWLILRGRYLYREYRLPASGGTEGFGIGGRMHHTLAISNSGPESEAVEIVLLRTGADARNPWPPDRSLLKLRDVRFDATSLPVEVLGLNPLLLRVTADRPVLVETFRVWLPGYRVAIDGKRAPYVRTWRGLVGVTLPAGTHRFSVHFRGTPELRLAVKWTLAVGCVMFTMAVGECFRLARRRSDAT